MVHWKPVLNQFDAKNNWFTSYQYNGDDHSISSNMVLHITGDKHDNIWLGTMRGLNKFDQTTKKFQFYTEADGLSNNEVSCVLPDDDKLWIGTRNGLSLFDIKKQTFLNFHEQSGMSSAGFLAGACIKSALGKFYFGTDNGLISFYPDSLDLNIPPPRLVVSDLRINNISSPEKRSSTTLDLPFRENTLSFRISALTYIDSHKNQLQYRMSGLDTTWLPIEPSGLINFTTLPADDYILEVKGKNSFGVYNERPLKLEITINPPYWQTWWFRLLSVFIVASIFTALYKARVSYLLDVEQEKQNADKLRNELDLAVEREALKTEKMRNEFAADFHDSIGTGLDILGLDIDLITDNQETPSKIRAQLSPLRESIDNLADMRKEMGWIINAKNDATDKLFERIRQVAFKRVPSGILSVDIPHNLPVVRLPIEMRRHLLNFVKEALTNAVKHAKASTIELKISHSDGIYTFAIADDGIGFDIDEEEKGEGLETMSLRAEAVGGKYTILQPDEGGSVIKLSVKIDDSSHYAS